MNKFAAVFFKNTQNGWRVTFIRECNPDIAVTGYARISTFDNELVLTGRIPADLKAGRFCKRPHKIIKVKEFRK